MVIFQPCTDGFWGRGLMLLAPLLLSRLLFLCLFWFPEVTILVLPTSVQINKDSSDLCLLNYTVTGLSSAVGLIK